jgi:hypothetical protein
MAHFDASGERAMSSIEFEAYTAGLWIHHHDAGEIRGCSSAFKDTHVTAHLVDAALIHRHDDEKSWRYDKSVGLIVLCNVTYVPFIRNVSWQPLLLQGTLTDPDSLYTLQPRNDFCLFDPVYGPLIMGEIVSDVGGSDRWRMLFEGIAVCRFQNRNQTGRKAIVLCFYLNKDYEMERYLVYQAAEVNERDVSVLLSLLWCQPD